jgi:hypothetical protein
METFISGMMKFILPNVDLSEVETSYHGIGNIGNRIWESVIFGLLESGLLWTSSLVYSNQAYCGHLLSVQLQFGITSHLVLVVFSEVGVLDPTAATNFWNIAVGTRGVSDHERDGRCKTKRL